MKMTQQAENTPKEEPTAAADTNKKSSILNRDFLASASVHKLFWGYLLCGSIFWLLVFYGTGMAFSYGPDTNYDAAGLCLLIVAVILYLWGFVFSVLSFRAAWRLKTQPLARYAYLFALVIYLITLFSGLFVFIHIGMMM